MSASLLERLESVCAKLEHFTTQLAGPSSGSAAAPASAPAASAAPAAAASAPVEAVSLPYWDALVSNQVANFVAACDKFPELEPVKKSVQTVIQNLGDLLKACKSCKKPSDADLAKFLEPTVKAIADSEKIDSRSKFFNQFKAYNEAISAFTWITQTTPRAFIQDILEAADFYFNKVLVDSKKEEGQKKTDIASFSTSLKSILTGMQAICVEHYKMGLEWNPKGVALNDLKPSSSSPSPSPSAPAAPPAAPAAPAAPPAPAPSAGAAAGPAVGGMGAVFGQLANVNLGLKKVTNDMKTKNMKDVPVLSGPTSTPAPAPVAAPKAVAAAPAKAPVMEERKGIWAVEHYVFSPSSSSDNIINIPDSLAIKQGIYVFKCKNVQIVVPNKCKNITIDNCEGVTIQFPQVVSIFEVINSSKVKAYCMESVPSVSIDNSKSVCVSLSSQALVSPPTFITASIAECNILIPGKNEDDDDIELPIPQQYQTVIKNGQLITEPVTHGSN